jgi:hypothetical protein
MTQPASNSNYTPDEINAVVTQLVQSSISAPLDTLGVRRTDLTFNDVQQAAAGVFILYPNSPFYVLQLGMQRVLLDQIPAETSLLDQLLAAVSACGRQCLPVSDVSPLFNIQAALQNLGTAATQRAGVYTDVTKTPAYQQYQQNLTSFLSGPGQTVKQNGAIVMTPQQAVMTIPGLVSQLQMAHVALVATITSLVGGIDDYNDVNLPSVVVQSVLANSASLVGQDAAMLNSMTPTQRLASVRSVVLHLLATKAVINTFGKFTGPTDVYSLDGLGTGYWDVNHPATPAVLTTDLGRSYSILAGVSDTLALSIDGAGPVNLVLAPGSVAEIDGTASDLNFIIGDGTHPLEPTGTTIPNNNIVKVTVGGVEYDATLGLSGDAEPAVVTGTVDTTIGSLYGGGGSLDGTTLTVLVNGLTQKSATLVAPINQFDLLIQLALVFGFAPAPMTATVDGNNYLVLATQALGSSSTLQVTGGTAKSVLGLPSSTALGTNARTRTADQVAADIQAALPSGVAAQAYYSPLHFSGLFDIPAGTDTVWTLHVPGSSDLVNLGVTTTDTVTVLSGPNAGTRFPITGVTSSTITVAGTTLTQSSANVQIGPLNLHVKIICTDPAVQVPAETTISVLGNDPVSAAACTTLGFVPGIFAQCGKSTPASVASDINSKTGLIQAGTSLVNTVDSLATAHADVTNASHVVFSEAAATGSTSYVSTTLTFTASVSLDLAGNISTGDTVAVRSGPSAGYGYVITTVNGVAVTDHALALGDVVVATGSFHGTASALVSVEFGPTINAQKYQVLTVESGANADQYIVASTGQTAIDVLLQTPLLSVLSPTSPTTSAVTLTVSIGDMFLTLASKNTTLSSEVSVAGSAFSIFFSGSSPRTQFGTTQYFALPSVPNGLQPGDLLQYFESNFEIPTAVYPIVTVNPGPPAFIQVQADEFSGLYPPSNASWQFTPQPPPFAQLVYGIQNNFTQVQTELQTWLALSENQPLFFTNLNALINPLLTNGSPTAEQVGAATEAIQALYQYVAQAEAIALGQDPEDALDAILQTFTIEPVPPVDTLISTYSQKGADAAIDTLLQGQFSAFFNLSVDGVSYSGALQEAVRAVAMNDLPVRKYNRPEAQQSQLQGQTASPDFEFVANAITESLPGPQVSPPADSGEPSNWGTTTGGSGYGSSGGATPSGITGQNRGL